MNRFFVACAAISLVFLFSGCGQSGPLYLPGDPSRIETLPPAPADTEEEEKEEDEAPEG
ncbi:MAG: lipoprotein [Woeseiaceae bacterium]